ncbi:LysM domain-containing protein [Colletotrichum salicis]|uniref:LysM domain-containing protein n=1 Tax=Colletotrichum salicis TaxID=1209931 RepID=A0A135V4N8_9PEZI|nr:LysM domain-containing protein [Colletotrichum salicis]
MLCLGAFAQYTERPPSTADPNTIKDCTWWFVARASDTCARVTATYSITQDQLVRYAPSTTTSAGNGVTTPQPTQPGMVSNCKKFYFVASGTGCSQVLNAQGISLADFYAWNPNVGADCSGMWDDVKICVGVIGGITAAPVPSTTSQPATTTTTTPAGNGIETPLPINLAW